MVGGMVLLAVGGAAAYKLSKKDADRIEQHTGTSVEELTDEELTTAMNDLNIQSAELTEEDRAALESDTSAASAGTTAAAPGGGADYLAELEQLGSLRDKGIITDEEFETKKKQLLGL